MSGLVTGVTGKNYAELGRAFIARNPDKTSVVIQRSSAQRDEAGKPYRATADGLRRWGAWHAYLRGIGYSTAFMERQDYFTVPAPWPSDFDAQQTYLGDYEVGDRYLEERRHRAEAEADRRAEIKAALADPPPPGPALYRPYPRLWEAFADQPEILDGRSFMTLTEASRLLAMAGRASALAYLTVRTVDGWKPPAPKPAPTRPSADEVDAVLAGLTSPARPISNEFKEAMKRQGYTPPDELR